MQLFVFINRDIEIEFFSQFDLPLAQDSLGRKDKNSPGFARKPCLTQQHTGLNGLPQPHFIGNKQLGRPVVIHAVKGMHLMRPRNDSGSRFAHPFAAIGTRWRFVDKLPRFPERILHVVFNWLFRLNFWGLRFLLPLQPVGKFTVIGQEMQQALSERLSQFQNNGRWFPVGPESLKRIFISIEMGRIIFP